MFGCENISLKYLILLKEGWGNFKQNKMQKKKRKNERNTIEMLNFGA